MNTATAIGAGPFVPELDRILALPRRAVLDCERTRDGTRRWSPQAQALIEVMTAKFSRGPRLSCGCRDRYIEASANGRLVVFHQGKPGSTPPMPLETTVEEFCRDNAHSPDTVKIVSDLRSGTNVTLLGLNRPCITTLNPVQAWVLRELPRAGGVLGFLSIGSGKTITGLLAPLAMPKCRTVVLLAKPDQRIHYRKHYLHLREHFLVPSIVFDKDLQGSYVVPGTPVLHFVPYSILQQKTSTDLLERLSPDMIIADEAHCLAAAPSSRSRGSTRAVRWLRYMEKYNGTHFCCWSGSLVNKKLLDVTHLAKHALGLGSPYPIEPETVESWSYVIDPTNMPDRTSSTARSLSKAFSIKTPGLIDDGGVREGLKARVVETVGVISTRSSSIATSISIHEREAPKLPDAVQEALAGVRNDWLRPDQEELVEATEQIKCAREVGAGFFYHWVYPKEIPDELITQWFLARKMYAKELRTRLMRAEPHLDSPSLCANAAERAWRVPRYDGDLPVWPAESWPAWAEIKDRVDPTSRAVWIDDYLARDAAKWAKEHRGILWYQSVAFGKKVAELAGINFHGGGKDAEANILAENGEQSIVASIKSHSEGRDGLQHKFHEQLIMEVPSSGKGWDQLLGRLAREGQEADEIHTWVYIHTRENRDALRKAIALAEFDESMSPNESLLLAADMDFDL